MGHQEGQEAHLGGCDAGNLVRLLLRALIGIVQTSAVSHPHEASNKVFNKDASEGCEAFS